jgi:hypothetical protein
LREETLERAHADSNHGRKVIHAHDGRVSRNDLRCLSDHRERIVTTRVEAAQELLGNRNERMVVVGSAEDCVLVCDTGLAEGVSQRKDAAGEPIHRMWPERRKSSWPKADGHGATMAIDVLRKPPAYDAEHAGCAALHDEMDAGVWQRLLPSWTIRDRPADDPIIVNEGSKLLRRMVACQPYFAFA